MTPTRLVTAALAALALVAPLAGTASAVPASASAGGAILGPNQVTTGDRVPWDKVGRGWYLTLVDQGPRGPYGIDPDHQLLDLVDPLGGRYQLAKTPVPSGGTTSRELVDWSADGHTALEMVTSVSHTPRAVVYDLPAGTHRSVDLGHAVGGISLGPRGSLYETRFGGRAGKPLLRRNADGTTVLLRTRTDGLVLPSADSRQLVVGTSRLHDDTLLLLTSHGRLSKTLHTPSKCYPTRWWTSSVVLASCDRPQDNLRLWAAPVDGAHGHWVSADHGKHSADLADLDARRLGGTTYLEAAGPCGVVFLARQHPDGRATQVHVPDATGNVYLIGTRAGRLVLHTGVSCDPMASRGGTGPRDAITHFDPGTGRDRVVAELPVDEAYGTILALGERQVPLV